MSFAFLHDPLPDTQDTTGMYVSDFSLKGLTVMGGPDSVFLHYSTDGFSSVHSVEAGENDNGDYSAPIPAQPAGTVVEYFFSAHDPLASESVRFPAGAPEECSYGFTVGYEVIYKEDFEASTDWIAGTTGDDAVSGRWEWARPQLSLLQNLAVVQPGQDHTTGEGRCFVTGALGGTEGCDFVKGGRTTLVSPTFDLRSVGNPVVQYYKWFTNWTYFTNLEPWLVQISSDGGWMWTTVELTPRSTAGWQKVQFRVADHVQPTSHTKLRFVARNTGLPGSGVEALIDDFSILGTGDSTVDNTPVTPAERDVMYALSDSLFRIEPFIGCSRGLGRVNQPAIHVWGLTVQPETGRLFTCVAWQPGSTDLYMMCARTAKSYMVCEMPVAMLTAIAFCGDTLFGATKDGTVCRIELESGDTVTVAESAGLMFGSLACHPKTGELWASAWPRGMTRDFIAKVNPETGENTLVGQTGDGNYTMGLAFTQDGRLFGLKGTGDEMNRIIEISTTTGEEISSWPTGLKGLKAIAQWGDCGVDVAAIDESSAAAEAFVLRQNYPNPFNPSTSIEFVHPLAGFVSLKVYNVLGEEMACLVSGDYAAGTFKATWDATGLPSGVYLYRLTAGDYVQTKKMVLCK